MFNFISVRVESPLENISGRKVAVKSTIFGLMNTGELQKGDATTSVSVTNCRTFSTVDLDFFPFRTFKFSNPRTNYGTKSSCFIS